MRSRLNPLDGCDGNQSPPQCGSHRRPCEEISRQRGRRDGRLWPVCLCCLSLSSLVRMSAVVSTVAVWRDYLVRVFEFLRYRPAEALALDG